MLPPCSAERTGRETGSPPSSGELLVPVPWTALFGCLLSGRTGQSPPLPPGGWLSDVGQNGTAFFLCFVCDLMCS